MDDMDYNEALAYVNSFTESRGPYSLDKIKELCKLCNFQLSKLRVIHVAGTNGKGSTTAFVSSILAEAGYKVGTYTSPHLLDIRERFKLNNQLISREKFAEIVSFIKLFAGNMHDKVSHFELLTAIAFKFFLDEAVDFAVVEVGLGGRLDATNVLDAEIAVITNIGLEHTELLGTTVQAIAKEKAGIIKPECLVATNAKGAALKTIEKIAKEKAAKLFRPKFKILGSNDESQRFDLKFPQIIKNLRINLLGNHQIENAALAVSSVLLLQKRNFAKSEKVIIPETAIRQGLQKAEWSGRIQVVGRSPLTVLDVAHNADGAEVLAKSLKIFNFQKLIIVFACLKDKDFGKMVSCFKKFRPFFIFTKPQHTERAIGIGELKNKIKLVKLKPDKFKIIGTIPDAIEFAKSLAGKNDLLLITGSHYTVAEAMQNLK